MLVATAIALIMLVMFAQIFRGATGTIIEQRGLAQNDARARMVATLLRTDLQKLTYRDSLESTSKGLLPLTGPADGSVDPVSSSQDGYVYISENDIGNRVDDLIQFTALVDQTSRNQDTQPYFGIASPIGRPSTASTGVGQLQSDDRNQPIYDDGSSDNTSGISSGGTAEGTQSRAAEITYFVRNGTLYRRVLLLRDPLTTPPTVDYNPDPAMEIDATGGPLIPGNYDANADLTDAAVGDFWNDFDFAAIHDGVQVAPAAGQVRFHGIASLDNSTAVGLLAFPQNRFGFRQSDRMPREYIEEDPTAAPPVRGAFIGRFTHEETSNPLFTWPATSTGIPFEDLGLVDGANDGLLDDGVVDTYADGLRRGEDILLLNVDSFDIKVWDPLAGPAGVAGPIGAFVDLGHSGAGAFNLARNRRRGYGPRTISLGPDGEPGAAGIDDDVNGTTDRDGMGNVDPAEVGWPETDDVINRVFDTWHPSAAVPDASQPNNLRPPFRPLIEPFDATKVWANGTYAVGARIFPILADSADPMDPNYDGIYYEVDPASTGTMTGATEPGFPKAYNTTVVDNEVVWRSYDNRIGLTMIQITVCYRDVGSNLPRQLTIIHSFSD